MRAARAAAKSAGAAADAGSSEPQPWGSARGNGEASGAGFGPAAGAHLDERQARAQAEAREAEAAAAVRIQTARAEAREGLKKRKGVPLVRNCAAARSRAGGRHYDTFPCDIAEIEDTIEALCSGRRPANDALCSSRYITLNTQIV